MKVLKVKVVAKAKDPKGFPQQTLPEVAFAGRSNVGKSTVINTLLGQKVALSSKTPGRTRSIDFFLVRVPGQKLFFVDLPGYGYAKVSKAMRREWKFLVESFYERETVVGTVLIVDINVPPMESDKMMIEWLRFMGIPFVVVATKADKMPSHKIRPTVERLAEGLRVDRSLFVPFSGKTSQGKQDLWEKIMAFVKEGLRDAKGGYAEGVRA